MIATTQPGEYHSSDSAPTGENAASHTRGVSSLEREQILRDPLVRQALELFDGVVTDMTIQRPTDAPEQDEPQPE
ncbi:MAG: hypothetical protein D6744_14840 [Planctomycetota bacterium]|nr:MAG: hypothetical protein D6744_14840 [Planctomycetota bacterium]